MKGLEGVVMLERVLKSISRYNMLPAAPNDKGVRVMVAVSGGPDSVCLLHVLRELGVNVVGVAHFNHKLRAEASDEDERFAAALAAEVGQPFLAATGIHSRSGNLEQNARNQRREFFLKLLAEDKCDRVALGHTRDDQAETVLFRILRGSGLSGLSAIPPTTETGLIRPLIEVTRADVEDYLRARKIAGREDENNRDRRFARNRIRHDLLPQLEREWNPQISESLAHLADLAFEEERYWDQQIALVAATILRNADQGIELTRHDLDAQPRAVARRLIRHAIAMVKGDLRGIDFAHIEGILDGIDAGVPGVRILGSFGNLRIEPADSPWLHSEPVTVNIPGTYATFQGSIRLEIGRVPAVSQTNTCVNLKAELAEPGLSRGPIVLRTWQAGDRYRPAGEPRDRKLKEMFQNARIPSWRRAGWPILECGGKILWAREFGAAEEFSADCQAGPVLQIWDMKSANDEEQEKRSGTFRRPIE